MLKYSVVLLLYRHQANTQGLYPIYLRITVNRKQVYISTGHYIQEAYWNENKQSVKAGHAQASTINPDIISRKQAAIKALTGYQVTGQQVTAAELKRILSSRQDLHNIFEFGDVFIKEVEHKRRPGTLKNYRRVLKMLEEFAGTRVLAFEQITHDYLVRFETYIRTDTSETEGGRQGAGSNYITFVMKTLKMFFNAARKRNITMAYPFRTYEMPEYRSPGKDYCTMAELDKLEEIADSARYYVDKQTAVYFLLGCYTGLRVSDWYQFDYNKNVKDGRLYLRAEKNKQWVTMPVVGRLARHLDRVRSCTLDITDVEINRTLKKMLPGKKLSTHCGRKTFAVTMCAEQGISLEVCAKLMGITVSVCEKSYYSVTPWKIEVEVVKCWSDY